jgi:hypothetical protein
MLMLVIIVPLPSRDSKRARGRRMHQSQDGFSMSHLQRPGPVDHLTHLSSLTVVIGQMRG